MTEALLEEIRIKLQDPRAVAVGEIGLDYYWPEPDPEIQRYWFMRQLQLAQEVDLPVVIHSREAAADTMKIMKDNHAERCGGVVHCYSYSAEMAAEFVKMGFYIGVGGVVTFKNARKLVEVTQKIPLEHLLLETDCPYLAPVPYRGKRNCSLYLPYVVAKIAEIKGVTEEEVIRVTEQNARNMYRLS
jgi:TatD DNase family protein